ncbi:MAG: sugar transferase [Alphaproteobacteria bacterium]|nr:sugar transferase [Alphaproteobacteria bacterium]
MPQPLFKQPGSCILKRLFDIFISLAFLVIAAPLLVVLAVMIYARLGAPIFFRQDRVGRNNRIFKIVKFRSMREPSQDTASDADRIPPFGAFLRSTSLDEIPELWNVLKGDMSLVGPRPLLVQYLPLYSPEQARRHEVRPGITGWAQINGRNALSWQDKFALDVWYVDNRSLWLDIKILGRTGWKVLKREGINADGEATMPFFTGND